MSDVSRETSPAVEPEPDAVAILFGDRVDRARAFAHALVRHGEERGLIGPQELPRLWTRHLLNSAVAAPLFAGRVADIGSGAGLPGLVLAIARPDVEWVLIEPMERRVSWLTEQVRALDLDNVDVVRSRAEDVRPRGAFECVTARAVSALRTLVPLAAPLVADGGELILLKGAGVDREIEAARKQLQRARLSDMRVEVLGTAVGTEATRVFRARVRASTP